MNARKSNETNPFSAFRNQTTGTVIKFSPIADTNTNEKYQCITVMKIYRDKSLEELRFEDCFNNKKGPQQQTSFGITPFGTFPNSASSSLFGQTDNKQEFGQKRGFGQTAFEVGQNSTFVNSNTFVTQTAKSIVSTESSGTTCFSTPPSTVSNSFFDNKNKFGQPAFGQATAPFGITNQTRDNVICDQTNTSNIFGKSATTSITPRFNFATPPLTDIFNAAHIPKTLGPMVFGSATKSSTDKNILDPENMFSLNMNQERTRNQLELEIKNVRDKMIQSCEDDFKKIINENSWLQNLNEVKTTTINLLTVELSKKNNKIRKLEEKIDKAEKELPSLKEGPYKKFAERNSKEITIFTSNEELKTMVHDLETEIGEMIAALKISEKEKKKLEEETIDLRHQNELNAAVMKLNEMNRKIIEEMKSELTEAKKKLINYAEIKKELESLNENIAKLQHKVTKKEDEMTLQSPEKLEESKSEDIDEILETLELQDEENKESGQDHEENGNKKE